MKKILAFSILILFLATSVFAVATTGSTIASVNTENETDSNESNLNCTNYYYFDNIDKNCSQKEFCGSYMYLGLKTFDTKEACLEASSNNTVCTKEAKLCPDGTAVGRNSSKNCKFDECPEYNETKINTSVVCTQDCPEVCCNLRGVHTTKCNKCICEKQYGGVVIGDKKCDKYPSRENLEKIKEAHKKLIEDIKQYSGEVKEIMKKYNGWINVTDKNITIHDLGEDKKEIIVDKINTKTGLNLTLEDLDNVTLIKTLLSNGRYAEIKILPNVASERVQEIMKTKCKERNCTFELKEVGIGNKTRLAYEIQTEKQSKFLYLFKNKMLIKAQVDAETGQVIAVKRPWWAFLAKEQN